MLTRFSRDWLFSKTVLAIVLIPCACLSPSTQHFTKNALNSSGGNGVGSVIGGDCTNPPSGGFGFCAASSQVLHLGVSKAFTIRLTAASNFEGDVALSIERSELDAIDTRARVNTQLGQAQVHLTPGASLDIPVMVQATTQSPTVNSNFKVVATRVGGGANSTAEVPLQVQAIYDVYLHGGASPETWDANAVGQPARFAPHAEGLTVNFINMDMAAQHIIHGTGMVDHQNTAQPLVVSPSNGVAGGTYTLNFAANATGNGTYYCHVHESSAVARQIILNSP